MARKRYSAEQIMVKLREAEVLEAKGKSLGEIAECYGVSERRACRVLGQCRATQRYVVRKGEDLLRVMAQTRSCSYQIFRVPVRLYLG